MIKKMLKLLIISLLAVLLLIDRISRNECSANQVKPAEEWTVSLKMPDIRPDYNDQYLCTAHRLDDRRGRNLDATDQWAVSFRPHANNSSSIHHMLIYACELPGIYQPGSPKFVWDCSQMARPRSQPTDSQGGQESTFEKGPVCEGQEQIIYAWAPRAPALQLPDKVGFRLAGDETQSTNRYLVLQVHYHGNEHHSHQTEQKLEDTVSSKSKPSWSFKTKPRTRTISIITHHGHTSKKITSDDQPEEFNTDNSGIDIDFKTEGITREAGVLLMSSSGYVEPGLSKHEIMCQLEDDVQLHPIRFRVHTHKLGKLVLGARLRSPAYVRNQQLPGYGLVDSELIGEHDPQEPQMFYPVSDSELLLNPGDTIYAACHFNNTNSWPIRIGPTSNDEMCNFYLMYWADGPTSITQKACMASNPRTYNDYQSLLI